MPDPIFESFQERVELSPPDPREIRRRGDRRRRRTAIATVAGAVVAVAAVIAPVAALTRGDDGPPPPAITPTSTPTGRWLLTVPENFPLGHGVPMPGEATAPVHQDEGTTLTACGSEIWSADRPEPWADVATATNADAVDAADGTDSRTLALYPDAATAKRVLADAADALDACPAQEAGGNGETVERVGNGNAWVVDRSESGGELFFAVRVGNALLLQRDGFGAAGPGNLDEELTFFRENQATVLEAMCIFAADPCPGSAPSATQQPTDPPVAHVDEIPDTFPIDVAHFDPGSDGHVGTPSQDAGGVILELCDADGFTMRPQDRLAFQVTWPEGADTRELRTYPSADDAVTQMQRLRSAVAGCPRQNPSDPGNASSWTTRDVDTGYDSVAVAMTYDQGLGGGVWLFTRVGRSILAVAQGGEYASDNVWDALPPLVDRTNRITPSMCLFTEAGC
jgi:hypothetical protein